MHQRKLIQILLLTTSFWALAVIGLGAYTRLANAGLGCPDWPGCYGHLSVPHAAAGLEPAKAWAEMIHRYFAGTLGILVLTTVVLSFRYLRRHGSKKQLIPVIALGLLLLYQPLLGMWTVTLKLLPIIVTQHLLGGLSMLGLLGLLYMMLKYHNNEPLGPRPINPRLATVGVILLFAQMMLGAWTSTNYAAISCSDFPFCQATTWNWDFSHAFALTTHTGPNYEGGLLSDNAKKTIQMVHRCGALITAIYWLMLSIKLIFNATSLHFAKDTLNPIKPAFLVISLLLVQIFLGIANVLFAHPLIIAVLHNLTAALLLLSVIRFSFYCYKTTTLGYRHEPITQPA